MKNTHFTVENKKIETIRKAKKIYVWSVIFNNDGLYIKVNKKAFLSQLKMIELSEGKKAVNQQLQDLITIDQDNTLYIG